MNALLPSCNVLPEARTRSDPNGAGRAECAVTAAGIRLKGGGSRKKFGGGIILVFEACNPLKSHKTAKALFGKAWTKTT
jgi:hypothetical protein